MSKSIISKALVAIGMLSWPFICYFVIEPEAGYLVYHGIAQCVLFLLVAHIPCQITGVMWWVDLAWPLGLVLIGAYNWFAT
jgi:hypothetical protein